MTCSFPESTNHFTLVDKLPLASYPVRNPISQERIAPYFLDWIAHLSYDNFSKELTIEEHSG